MQGFAEQDDRFSSEGVQASRPGWAGAFKLIVVKGFHSDDNGNSTEQGRTEEKEVDTWAYRSFYGQN